MEQSLEANSPLAPVGSFELDLLDKLAVTNQTGLLRFDRRKVHPITYQVLPSPLFSFSIGCDIHVQT